MVCTIRAMTTTSYSGVTGSLKHRPVPAHPLTNAANLLEQAAALVEDAAREVALAAAQAPLQFQGNAHLAYSHGLGENACLEALTKYAAKLGNEALEIAAQSRTCQAATP